VRGRGDKGREQRRGKENEGKQTNRRGKQRIVVENLK
jgi:hypothetical protein